MKKRLLAVILSLYAFLAFSESARLLSFNMNGRRSLEFLELTAKLITEEGADLVFLQEVFINSRAEALPTELAGLLNRLQDTSGWSFATTYSYSLRKMQTAADGSEVYKTGGSNQNNAILYNKDKLGLYDLADEIGFTHFDGDFLFDKNNVQLVEIRLKQDQDKTSEEKSFTAINVHLPFADYEHRIRDLATLERLYARFKQRSGVIIAGDFNLHRAELMTRNFDGVDGEDSWYYNMGFGLKTTLSAKASDFVKFSNDYDHFVFSRKIKIAEKMQRAGTASNADSCNSVQFGDAIYLSSVSYRNEISDHIPIVIELEF